MRSMPALYKGQAFRSRLEARWACWYDLIGVRWVYEPDVIDLGNFTYIPDFFLPDWQAWVEIKGEMISDEEGLHIVEKCRQLAIQSELLTILCFDQPYDPRCAVFYKGAMYAPAYWRMCRFCGGVALEIQGKGVRCPTEHGALPLDLAARQLRSRFIYEAAITARQARFGWPRKKAS